MLRYTISILFLLLSLTSQAQGIHPLEVGRQPMLRFSFDPSVSLKSFMQEANISGFEASVDSEIKQNLFLFGGFGMMNVQQKESAFSYNNNGMYISLGADLNLTAYQSPKDRDIFFMGLHYGYAILSHEATDIYMENEWGNTTLSIPQESRTASWVEVVAGVKAEVGKNLFLGWTGKIKTRTSLSSGAMKPYYIPGFGKTASNAVLDLNLWLSYAISFKAKQNKPKEIE